MGGGRAYPGTIDIFQNKSSIIPTVGWNSHIKCPYPHNGIETFSVIQCCSKGNISRGSCERWRREPLGGSGGMLRQKILQSRDLEMLFPAFSKSYLWFKHITNYLLRTLSQQTNAHWEYNTWNINYKIENWLSLYLETSKCFTFESHHSKFIVIKLSELP